ncbi:hypothetical protein JQK15_24180 [Sphingobium sp. BHU LFT2]|uniref:hypothetical protein n=1 Tax=Sphingobium sp. BHU LFT2 TaxID=2807634 RepID=UPI001BE914AF|nr:hypothetical protein [Sphingobium sp. BHU LFT2]MBT2246608.1 hypothetical protein [Sphingobium sp. BHU LFT2]
MELGAFPSIGGDSAIASKFRLDPTDYLLVADAISTLSNAPNNSIVTLPAASVSSIKYLDDSGNNVHDYRNSQKE